MPDSNELKEMVERVEWMVPIHYEILEKFRVHQAAETGRYWATARAISTMIDKNRGYTSEKMKDLVESGLLEKDGTIYSLSELGKRFVNGEASASELANPFEE